MIVVVEGPDNAGKTTLAQYLAKEMRAVFIKVERPKRAVDLKAYQHVLNIARSYSGVVVTDRHVAISEPIYGPICRGGHDLQQGDIEICCSQLDAMIYCRPPDAVIMKTISERAQMEGVVENTSAIIEAYDQWYERVFHQTSRYDFLGKYDFTKDQREHVLAELKAYREREYHV